MAPLAGKVAVVTGASRGIGKGIALVLAEQGAIVYVTGRTVNPGEYYLPGTVGETAAQCTERGKESGGKGIAFACDHADDDQVAALFQKVKDEVRRDIMRYYLEQTRLDFLHVSERLGFSEQSVMTRTCRRWLGGCPSEIRARAAAAR